MNSLIHLMISVKNHFISYRSNRLITNIHGITDSIKNIGYLKTRSDGLLFYKKFSLDLICIAFLLLVCTLINIFMYNKHSTENEKSQLLLLNLYAKEVEGLILKDFQKIFQHNYKTEDLIIIKNLAYENNAQDYTDPSQIVYVSNNILHINNSNKHLVIDLSYLKQLLDSISKDLFLYGLCVNDKQILTNTLVNLTNEKFFSIAITKGFLLNLNLKNDNNSEFVQLINNNFKKNILQIFCLSIIMFFIGVFIILYFLKQRRIFIGEREHKKNILSFIEKDKEFIRQCYTYSKKSQYVNQSETNEEQHNEYLPLSIVHNIEKNRLIEVVIDKIIPEIKSYFFSYKKYYRLDNIELDVMPCDFKNLLIPFDQEVFYQIMISIVYNFINFNRKSRDKRKIILVLKKTEICIFSEGLKLNKQYAIKASEMIFQDTANPYLMNFGQMFVLFSRYNMKCDVCYENNGTNITILLPNREKVKNTNCAVIKLNEYRK